ncbi:unnamed protein product, partial [Pocillopora meandrina]
KKSITLKRTKISHYFTLRERKKPNLSEIIQAGYQQATKLSAGKRRRRMILRQRLLSLR